MNKTKSAISQWWKNLKHKEVIIAVIAIVIMLVVYFSTKITPTVSVAKTDNYCERIQTEIHDAVKKISGDSNAKIVINWVGSVEKEYAKSENITTNGSSSNITILQNSNGASALVVKEKYPTVQGVVVVVNNANNPKIKVEIMELLMTLFGITSEKIGVYSGN